MSNLRNRQQKSPAKRFLFILGVAMFTLYLAIGLAVIFWKDFPLDMALGYRIAFGALLIAYAFIRFMRLLQQRD